MAKNVSKFGRMSGRIEEKKRTSLHLVLVYNENKKLSHKISRMKLTEKRDKPYCF
jgi:hypothetical protein